MSRLPETFVLNKFYAYSYDPVFRKHDGTYNAGCPICKEGKSLGKKKRLFFYPESNTFHCFNCSQTWSAYSWITKVCNMTKDELDHEISTNSFSFDIEKKITNTSFTKSKELPDLPYDSINMFDEVQQKYYLSNPIFKKALNYIKNRRLDVAVNKSPNLFISLTDVIHKNRICIPFYDLNKKINFYQTRCLDDSIPKYLGKRGYEKTLFGIDRVDFNLPYVFIFEGPIDAMFVKNGVSAAGLSLTKAQESDIGAFPFHERIWVLDNPKFDKTADEKTREFISDGKKVFKWTNDMPYKDFNDMAKSKNLDEINYQVILDSLY
jgi:hypothetical protein